jgi:hypothetical protein
MTCLHERTYFDRSLCPEPCDTMHDRCKDCGQTVGFCAHEKAFEPTPHQREWAEIAREIHDREAVALFGAFANPRHVRRTL